VAKDVSSINSSWKLNSLPYFQHQNWVISLLQEIRKWELVLNRQRNCMTQQSKEMYLTFLVARSNGLPPQAHTEEPKWSKTQIKLIQLRTSILANSQTKMPKVNRADYPIKKMIKARGFKRKILINGILRARKQGRLLPTKQFRNRRLCTSIWYYSYIWGLVRRMPFKWRSKSKINQM